MNNLIFRFVLGVFCAFLIVTLLWTGVLYWRTNMAASGSASTSSEKLLFAMINQAIADTEAQGASDLEQMPAELEKLLGQKVRLIFIDSPEILEPHRRLLSQGNSAVRMQRSLGGPIKTFFIPQQGTGRILVIGPVEPQQFLNGWQMVGFIMSVMLVVSATGTLIALPTLAMMQAMVRTSHKIIDGDIGARIPVNIIGRRFLPPDIRKVLVCFNQLADHNQQLFQKQQHLLQAVAHELRTPTARMRFELEMLALAQTDQQREERLQALDEDVCEIDGFIDELVAYNRLEYGDALELTPISVSEVFEKVTTGLVHIIGGRNISLVGGEGVMVKADRRLFGRALKNLIANAIRHCREKVVVRCETKDDTVKIHVDDDGFGIPAENRKMIFEPFARLEGSRNKMSGGLGLGLAIVQRIVSLHGAQVTVDQAPAPLNGARFSLIWSRSITNRKSLPPIPAPSVIPSLAGTMAVPQSAKLEDSPVTMPTENTTEESPKNSENL